MANDINVDHLNRPSQQLTWSQKVANNYKWFKDTADYYISQAGMFHYGNESYDELNQLYEVYNNNFPAHWFSHVTNPIAAKNPLHKRYPAKIRSTNILRTNIDQLIGEYARRPFVYQVVNKGEDGYNRYTSSLQQKLSKNLTDHFVAMIQEQALQQGVPMEEIPQPDQIEMPWEVQEKFKLSYKDALAVDGQRWLRRALDEYRIHRKRRQMFTDWLIAGAAFSYKNIENNDLVYEIIDPRELEYDKAIHQPMIEDGEWVVRRQWFTLSEVVDRFYEFLKEEDLIELDRRPFLFSVDTFATHLRTIYGDVQRGKIPVYHCQWKARKKFNYIMAIDANGELIQEIVDEDHVPNPDEKMESHWGNEVYECWRIGKDIYVNARAVPVQRNAMNNFSTCKLSYNGAKYSPTTTNTFSVFKQGIPLQILYIINNYQLEKTIAKNKGKVVFMDKNAIPNTKGWDEEKFFWYSDTMGYALINRNQPGVDKSWNQYHVLDLSTFKDIKELIDIQNWVREQWDLITGFNAQRRGQTAASSQSGATAQAVFQSNLVTDLIFLGFEDFVETELQGLLDLSKFLNVDGVKGLYNGSTYDHEILNIDPVSYCNADFGILLSKSPEEQDKLNIIKQILQPLLQNGMTPMMALEMIDAGNMAEIKAKLMKLEDIQQRQQQQQQQAEQDAEEKADKRLAAIEAMKNELKMHLQDNEYQWKERIAVLEGEINMNSAALLSKDETVASVPDIEGIFDRYQKTMEMTNNTRIKTMEMNQKERMQQKELAQRRQEMLSKERIEKKKASVALKNKVSGEK